MLVLLFSYRRSQSPRTLCVSLASTFLLVVLKQKGQEDKAAEFPPFFFSLWLCDLNFVKSGYTSVTNKKKHTYWSRFCTCAVAPGWTETGDGNLSMWLLH